MGEPKYPVVLDATVDSDLIPSWGTFAACHVFWPAVAQVILTIIIFPVGKGFSNLKESSSRLRWFVSEYIGDVNQSQVERTPHPWFLYACNLVQLILSLVSVYDYAQRTYTPQRGADDKYIKRDLVMSLLFILLYFTELLRGHFQVAAAWRLAAIVDLITVVPVMFPRDIQLHSVPMQQRWITLAYLRIYSALCAYEALVATIRALELLSELAIRLMLACLRTLTLVVCMSGTIFVLEVLGEIPGFEPTKIATEMGELSFIMMNYWIITTISTVGYGDYSPKTIPAQLVIIVFIFIGVIFFGIETSDVANLKWSLEEGLGRYSPQRSSDRHVLIIGSGVSRLSSMMKSFLQGMMDSGDEMPNLVLLSDVEYDKSLVHFIEKSLHPRVRKRTYLLRGSSFNIDDLDRVLAGRCDMVFILPMLARMNIFEQDEANILRALEMQRLLPDAKVRLMLLAESSSEVAVTLGIPRERCFSAHGLKASLLATSARVNGFPAMIAGLLDTGDWKRDHFNPADRSAFMRMHNESVNKDAHALLIGIMFDKMPWGQAVTKVYEESGGCVLLIGAQIEGKLQLNPNASLEAGQVVVAVSERARDLDMFRDDSDQDWRSVFRERRGEMLQEHRIEARFGQHASNKINVTVRGSTTCMTLQEPVRARPSEQDSADAVLQRSCRSAESPTNPRISRHSLELFAHADETTDFFEHLKKKPCLILLIVLDDCIATWDQIKKFLANIRSPHLPKFQPFIVFSPEKAPEYVSSMWAHDHCAFVSGNVVDSRMLEYAGASVAEHIVVFRGLQDKGIIDGEASDIDMTSDDYKVLTISLMLTTIIPESPRFEVFELGSTQAALAMEKQLEALKTKTFEGSFACIRSHHTRIFSNDILVQASGILRRTQPRKETCGNRELLMLRSFAEGHTFTPDFFGGILSRFYSFPITIEFVEAMCIPEEHDQKSFVWQVTCPAGWAGKTFRDLLLTWAEGKAQHGTCLSSEPALVLGIYRQSGQESGSLSACNLILPPSKTELLESDLLTVLGSKDFGAHAAESCILRGCPINDAWET